MLSALKNIFPQKPGSKEEQFLRDELVKLWLDDQDEKESNGPNRSPMIDAVNKRLGVPMGSPYCIGGLLVRGVEVLCTKYSLRNPVIMTAGTQNFYNRADKKFVKPKGKTLKKADIGILQQISDPAHGHAYGLTKDEDIHQYTIEYNTNGGGSRDGDGVYQLVRGQGGTATKRYRGGVDVVAWILSVNPQFKV